MNLSILILGLMLGLTLGVVATLTLFGASSEFWAATGAIIGAGLTVAGAFASTRSQLAVQEQRRVKQRETEQLAARALLAVDLSEIGHYCQKSADFLMENAAAALEETHEPNYTVPVIPPELLERTRRLIELADRADADQLVDLLHCYQIQHARVFSTLDYLEHSTRIRPRSVVPTRHNFGYPAISIVELYLRAIRAFPYARLEQKHINPPPFSETDVHDALSLLNLEGWLEHSESDEIRLSMTNLDPLGRWRS